MNVFVIKFHVSVLSPKVSLKLRLKNLLRCDNINPLFLFLINKTTLGLLSNK